MCAHILCVCACSGWGRELGVCMHSSNTNSSIGGQVSDQLQGLAGSCKPLSPTLDVTQVSEMSSTMAATLNVNRQF